jgi:hypothetical protein
MDGTSRILLVIVAATLPAALIHELGRAAAALLLTRGRVIVLLGSGRPLASVRIGRLLVAPTARLLIDGECLHEPTTSPRRATAILLAGPLIGDVVFLATAALALTWHGGVTHHPTLQLGLFTFALVSLARASADLVRAHGHRPGLVASAPPEPHPA